jgi:hypothetical protein
VKIYEYAYGSVVNPHPIYGIRRFVQIAFIGLI